MKNSVHSIRILIAENDGPRILADAMIKVMPATGNFEIKTLKIPNWNYYVVLIDLRELWFPIPSIGSNDAIIITDAKEMVELAKRQFELLWNDGDTIIKEGLSK